MCGVGQDSMFFFFQLLRNVKESFFDSVMTTGKLVLSLVTPGPGQAVLLLA